MQKIVWQDTYSIGDATIDQQHQQMFDIATTLLQASDKAALVDAAMNLYRYMREHFRDEEELMRRIAYPEYRQHVEMHNWLIDRMNAVSADIGAGRWRAETLRNLMDEWVVGHILDRDTQLLAYVQSQAPGSTILPPSGMETT